MDAETGPLQPSETTPSTTCAQETMIRLQSPSIPESFRYQMIPGCRTFANLPPPSFIREPVPDYPKLNGDWKSDGSPAFQEHVTELLRLFYRMGKPLDVPQRKPASEVLSAYGSQLSKKKTAVLALAMLQVECEESEAVLLEEYGLECLKDVQQGFYSMEEHNPAMGRYFDAVSGVRFDQLEE